MWTDLLAAIGLMLVLEGIMPFINPSRVRRTLQQMLSLPDNILRILGLGSMIIGLLVLYFVR